MLKSFFTHQDENFIYNTGIITAINAVLPMLKSLRVPDRGELRLKLYPPIRHCFAYFENIARVQFDLNFEKVNLETDLRSDLRQ